MWPFLADADVAVAPSRLDESFGNTLVEALLAGRPAVVADHTGLREIGADLASVAILNEPVAANGIREYSSALDKGGAEALNRSMEYWEAAYKNSAIASEATLGQEPDKDIQRLIKGQAKVFKALARNPEALKSLVSNFNTTAAAFAREDDALQRTIPALDRVLRVGSPALESLNGALPSLRAFARDAYPGTVSSGPTIDASMPFIRQARLLVDDDELKGLAADLRSAIPDLVDLQKGSVGFFEQTRSCPRVRTRCCCRSRRSRSPSRRSPTTRASRSTSRPRAGSSASPARAARMTPQTPFFRVQASGGPFSVHFGDVGGEDAFAQAPFPIEGVNPIKPDKRPGFRPDVACETQEPPNLQSRPGEGEPSPQVNSSASLPVTDKQKHELDLLIEHMKLTRQGIPSLDPQAYKYDISRRFEARRNNFEKNSKGLFSMRGLDSSGREAK